MNRRQFVRLTAMATAGVLVPLPAAAAPAPVLVAAHDAPEAVKVAAYVVCPGIRDNLVINDILARGISVRLSGGNFHYQ